jgi:hypothetical protein
MLICYNRSKAGTTLSRPKIKIREYIYGTEYPFDLSERGGK